ncbi:hypothetical protein BH10ACI2_BH10ACI2_17790 [soil metagenome]
MERMKYIEQKLRVLCFSLAIVLSFLAFCTNLVRGQDKPQTSPPPVIPPAVPAANTVWVGEQDGNYVLKSGDVIEIRVEKAPELSGIYTISKEGIINFPELGRLTAEKKTADEMTKLIADKLRGNYLTNPIVFVYVKERKTQTFFIQGSVRNPGTYRIEGNPSLLRLITLAGGLNENYGSTAFVIHQKKSLESSDGEPSVLKTINVSSRSDQSSAKLDSDKDDEYELIKANINSLLRGSFDQNVIIRPNDIVHIPKFDIFFVSGEVKAPGSFQLREGTTLRQAISLAQGTKFEGALERGIIFREDQTGKRQEIMVDIGAIMSGKKQDMDIWPNDIIMIPNSKTKTLASGAFKTVSGGLLRTLFGY